VPFDVQYTTLRGHAVLTVLGDLDLLTAPVLAEAVEKALATPAPLVLDLTGTTFLDSSGAREIARAARAAARAGLPVQAVCPPGNRAVRLVFDLLDLASVVSVLRSAEEIGRAEGPPV
jgi:anti-sigma B factor antagonist